MSGPDDQSETYEQGDDAIDEASRLDPDFIEEMELDPSLDPNFQVDQKELEEAGAELDDPEQMATLDGLIDDPDGLGEVLRARTRDREEDPEGWDLDAPIVTGAADEATPADRWGARAELTLRRASVRTSHATGAAVDRGHAAVAVDAEPSSRPPRSHRPTRSGSRSRARAMATKANPSASADSTVSRRLTPPSRMSGRSRAARNCRAWGAEEALLERVLLQEPLPHHREPEAQRLGQRGGELRPGRVPPEQVHRVGQRAPPGQLQGVEVPVGLEHRRHVDALGDVEATRHAVGHVELGRDGHAGRPPPRGRRPPPGRGKRARCSSEPPHPSRPSVEPGAQERAEQVVVAEVDLDAVEPGRHGGGGAAPVVVGDAGDVRRRWPARVNAPDAPKRRLGDSAGARLDRELATGPAWPIWAEARAPASWTAAVSRRQPVERPRAELDAVPVGATLGGHGQVGHRGHGHAAAGHPLVEGDEVVGDLPPGEAPSNVADLMIRFFSVSGPSRAGAEDRRRWAGASATGSVPVEPGRSRAPRPAPRRPASGWQTTRSGSHGSGRA